MKEKNVTMRDVASLAGVSVATVSYVLNDKQSEKISEETRRKVWQIVNLLDYQPSRVARTLATGRSHLAGVYAGSAWQAAAPFCAALGDALEGGGYRMVLLSTLDNTERLRELDAVVLVSQPARVFKDISDRLLRPILCVDMLPNDSLFYQVYDDYARLFAQAKVSLGDSFVTIAEGLVHEAYRQWVQSLAPGAVHAYTDPAGLQAFLRAQPAARCLCVGETAALATLALSPDSAVCAAVPDAGSVPPGVPVLPIDTARKAALVCECLESAVNRVDGLVHDLPV